MLFFKICTDEETHKKRGKERNPSFVFPTVLVLLSLAFVPSTHDFWSVTWANLKIKSTMSIILSVRHTAWDLGFTKNEIQEEKKVGFARNSEQSNCFGKMGRKNH